MDNTPIGPLRANGIRDIIVVDVGSVDDTSLRNYGDSVSGWWLFVNRYVLVATGVHSSHAASTRSSRATCHR
jgi:predicted acylesterase/phospholipase RssA